MTALTWSLQERLYECSKAVSRQSQLSSDLQQWLAVAGAARGRWSAKLQERCLHQNSSNQPWMVLEEAPYAQSPLLPLLYVGSCAVRPAAMNAAGALYVSGTVFSRWKSRELRNSSETKLKTLFCSCP